MAYTSFAHADLASRLRITSLSLAFRERKGRGRDLGRDLGSCRHTRMVPLAGLEVAGPSSFPRSLRPRTEEHQIDPLNSSIGVDWRMRLGCRVA
jgi:hypothetical protein